MLFAGNGRKDDVVIRGARVLDPSEGIDAVCDVRVDGGTIAQLGTKFAPASIRSFCMRRT